MNNMDDVGAKIGSILYDLMKQEKGKKDAIAKAENCKFMLDLFYPLWDDNYNATVEQFDELIKKANEYINHPDVQIEMQSNPIFSLGNEYTIEIKIKGKE